MNAIEKMLSGDVPAIVSDSEGFITQVNALFLETYSWKKEELIDAPLTIIIPDKFHDSHNLSFSRFLKTGISSIFSQWIDLGVITGKGEMQIAKHFIFSCETPEGIFLAAQIKPIE